MKYVSFYKLRGSLEHFCFCSAGPARLEDTAGTIKHVVGQLFCTAESGYGRSLYVLIVVARARVGAGLSG